jgi:hypothetical protein
MKTLNFFVLSLLASVTSLNAHAASLPETRVVKKLLSPVVLAMQGVNRIGIGGGAEDGSYCVTIGTETTAAARALQTLFPEGTEIQGVCIVISEGGTVVPQPRLTGGN